MTDTAAEWAFIICLSAYAILIFAPALVVRITDKNINVSVLVRSKKGLNIYIAENVEVQLGWVPVGGYIAFMLVQAIIRVMWIAKPAEIWLGAWLGLGVGFLTAVIATSVLVKAKRNAPTAAATAASAVIGLFWSLLMVLIAVQINR